MTYQANVSIPYYSGDAADVVVNTFHVNLVGGGEATPTELETLAGDLISMYEAAYTGGPGSGLQFAPWVNLAGTRVTIYDLDQTPPRVPVYDDYLPITSIQPTNASTPLEVAMCVSYRAQYLPGVARARQRGRIYLGALSSHNFIQGTSSTFPGFNSTVTTHVAGVMSVFLDDLLADGWVWVVFSRTNATAYPIVAGWVDSEYDTQRRRGNVMTGTRIPWS